MFSNFKDIKILYGKIIIFIYVFIRTVVQNENGQLYLRENFCTISKKLIKQIKLNQQEYKLNNTNA